MSTLNEIKEVYLAVGIGGASFLALLGVLFYSIKSIYPLLKQILEHQAITQQVIANNTDAVKEMGKSNQNVATALQILDKSMNNVHVDVQKTLNSTENVEKLVLVMDAKLDKNLKED